MAVPSPWAALILVAAAYRLWRLLAEDTILNTPRRRLVNLPLDWEEGEPVPDDYRIGLANFISCPACFGFWISLSVWLLWEANAHWTEVFSMPFAISAAVIVVRARLDPPD
jgi:hypothetical protein